MTTKQARRLSDRLLFLALDEVQGYLRNPHLDTVDAAEYRAGRNVIASEMRRREI